MEATEYEKAWADGEEASAPAVKAVKSAAEEARDREAKEFSDAFFADDPANTAPEVAAEVEVAAPEAEVAQVEEEQK